MRTPTRLLVTFCNKHRCPDLAPGVFFAEVDPASGEARPVSLDLPGVDEINGVTGITPFEDGFAVGVQAGASKLLLLDSTLRTVEVVSLARTRGIHSLLAFGGFIFMASTGTDQVTSWSPGTEDVVVATLGSGLEDTLHFNAMTSHDDRILVSLFGPQVQGDWLETHHGKIMDLETGAKISDANHPHSLTVREGEPIWCESNEWRIATEREHLPVDRGYARGLAVLEDRLVVGSSVRRSRSRSTGRAKGGEGGGRVRPHLCRLSGRPPHLRGSSPAVRIPDGPQP